MKQNLRRLLPDQNSGKRSGIGIKWWCALILGVTALLGCVLPGVIYHTPDTRYSVTPLGAVCTTLLFKGEALQLPVQLRLFAAGVLICAAAGLVALLCRRGKPASICYACAGVCAIGAMLTTGGMEQAFLSAGAQSASTVLGAGFALPAAALLLGALLLVRINTARTMAETLFLWMACVSVGSVVLITVYMLAQGIPAIARIGLGRFLFGTQWSPASTQPQFGIAYMVLASVFGTLGAVAVGVPVGILTAVFLAELAPRWLAAVVRPAVELLAGIPSVIYGFFGMRVIVPGLRALFPGKTNGDSLLAVILILSVMILPTIINVAENALRAVPGTYREASLALGNTKIGTIFKVQLPAARSGILAGVILGVGRAIGETMAIIMVAGNIVQFPVLFGAVRPLTAGITFEMGYATGLHRQALFGIGLVLFVFIMLINIAFTVISRKGAKADAS